MNDIEENEVEQEEVEVLDVDERPLSSAEDVELDVREAVEELKGEEEAEEPLEQEPVKVAKQAKSNQKHQVNDVAPPASWKAEGKEWFLRQPVEVKRELARRASDLDKEIARVGHEKVRIQKEYADIEEVFQTYQSEWGKFGLTRSEAIKYLANADMRLRYDLENSLEELARGAGTSLEEIVAKRLGGQAPSNAVSNHQNSTLMNLQKKIELLESERHQELQSKYDAARNHGISEFENFRNERDSQGRFLRPELHDEQFAPIFEPIVQGIRSAFPGATPREVLTKAYTAVTGKTNFQPRVPPINTQHIQNAKRAALSVPGSRASQAPINKKIPDSVEETALEVARELGYI